MLVIIIDLSMHLVLCLLMYFSVFMLVEALGYVEIFVCVPVGKYFGIMYTCMR